MAKHRVNWHLHIEEKHHREGDVIELSEKHAQELVPLGVVTPLEESAAGQVEALAPEELARLSKAKLAAYAAEKFGATLDASAMNKDEMLAEIATLAAEN